MGKNKLRKFAELETLPNAFQCHQVDPAVLAGKWHSDVFHNENPIVLELGCGRGDYTVGLAQRYPDKNFIGVDIKGARLWAGAKQAHTSGIANAAFLRTSIEFITSYFAAGEVSEVWITFPDPQMKKASKRLTSTYFMARYQQIVRPDGLIHLKTDSPFLYTYTREMLRLNDYPVLCDTADLYAADAADALLSDARALQTHYEQQWLERGLTIKYLRWSLVPREQFEEPTIDIEHDSYRSYGRFYRNGSGVLPNQE